MHCIAKKNALILAEGNKTAYATAYIRLILMLKAGKIGDVISVDVTSTSLSEKYFVKNIDDHLLQTGIVHMKFIVFFSCLYFSRNF